MNGSAMRWMYHPPARRFHIAEYQVDDQVRTGCRHRGASRVFEELAPHGRAQGDKDHPPRIGGIEVGSDHYHHRCHSGSGGGQSEEHTHTHTCNA